MQQPWLSVLKGHPIIAAIRDPANIQAALASPVQVLFLLCGHLLEIEETVRAVLRERRMIFVHLDLVEGLAKDVQGLRWLARTTQPTGIITTRSSLINAARGMNLATIQRVFLLDSQSLTTGVDMAREARPDVVELLPGVLPDMIAELGRSYNRPIIAGGLIKTPEQCRNALAAGAWAVSTSNKELWRLTAEEVIGRKGSVRSAGTGVRKT